MGAMYLIGWISIRVTLAYVYLYALYLNTHDEAARMWLITHTAYLFPGLPEPRRTLLAKIFAIIGMLMMLFGGLSILFGAEPRAGAFLLLVFTAGGIYQHRREREVAMETAAKAEPFVQPQGKADFSTLQWSAYAGQLSSGLKNWALCGVCTAIIGLPTGPLTISDKIASFFS